MSERRRARARWATATLAALAFTSAHVGARAAEPSDVESLRAAFTAAYEEESRGNVAAALSMFRAVQRERDTASVRYRVAACLDALARRPEALAAYRSVSEVARPGDAAVVESARARAQAEWSRWRPTVYGHRYADVDVLLRHGAVHDWLLLRGRPLLSIRKDRSDRISSVRA